MSWYGLISFCLIYTLAVATPGPGVATARKYTAQNDTSPYHDTLHPSRKPQASRHIV